MTSCGTYRHFSSTCKWYLLFENDYFVEKLVLKILNRKYILLGNNHIGNIFAEVITTKPVFASAKNFGNCRLPRWISKAEINHRPWQNAEVCRSHCWLNIQRFLLRLRQFFLPTYCWGKLKNSKIASAFFCRRT